MKQLLGVFLLCCGLSGCGGNSSNSPANLNGNWLFTLTPNSSGPTLLATGALVNQMGGSSGSLTLSGTPCSSSAALSGGIGPGTAVNFLLQVVDQAVFLSGVYSSTGTGMSGTYAIGASEGCPNIGTGTWTATKCGSSCPTFDSQARFVNAISNVGAMEITVNGTAVVTDLPFFGYQPTSGYIQVPTGNVTVGGQGLTNGITLAFSSAQTFTSAQYTLVIAGNGGSGVNGLNLLSIPDTNPAPRMDSVEFRVIDASQSQGNVDIYLGSPVQGQAVISGLAYTQVSNYIELAYGNTYTLYVTAAGLLNPLFSQSLGAWQDQSIHTIVLTDASNGASINPQAILLDDYN
jgi:hypothetical protein